VRVQTVLTDAPSSLERLLHRDRLVVGCGLAVLIALSWAYLARMAGGMHAAVAEAEMHAAMGMPEMGAWGVPELAALFLMWAVMMAGMMVPSAAPVILLVLRVYRRRGDQHARVSAAAFVGGYLVTWTTFSATASAAQFGLHRAAVLTPEMASGSALLAGAILLIAGLYQWLPLKNTCLTHCQSPLGFITRHWREGAAGGFMMGVRHGIFCVGCCWALMALLFVVGVMNLMWVAAIAAYVLIEKLTPQGLRIGRVAGGLLIIWGIYVLTRSAVG
jgi:predicted metal-binding membrane protein